MEDISDPAVAEVFARYPDDLRAALLATRNQIITVARENSRIGDLDESLKWGQPAYRPPGRGIGTTLRIDALKGSGTRYALYFPCQTNLAERFRSLYADRLEIVGKRAILLTTERAPDRDALGHCISMALTYHLRRS